MVFDAGGTVAAGPAEAVKQRKQETHREIKRTIWRRIHDIIL
jgi:hypothetical protein